MFDGNLLRKARESDCRSGQILPCFALLVARQILELISGLLRKTGCERNQPFRRKTKSRFALPSTAVFPNILMFMRHCRRGVGPKLV